MKNFGGTKSLINILGGLKSNDDIFREIICLFNPKNNILNNFCISTNILLF